MNQDIWSGVDIHIPINTSSEKKSTWTEQEITFLKENHNKIGRKKCAEALNRTLGSIACKCKKLGLLINNEINPDIVSFLKENYAKLGPVECSKILGLPKKKIYSIATSRKIHSLRNKDWHDHEVQYLKDNLYKKSIYEIAQFLQRTQSSIKNKLNKLSLLDDNKWTKEEDDILKKYYEEKSLKELSEIFKRSISAISGRAFKLKITKKNKIWTEEDDEVLRKIYPTKETVCCAAILNTSESSIINRANLLGIVKNNKFIYEPGDLKKCSCCKEAKIIEEFQFQKGKNIYSAACKECLNTRAKNRVVRFAEHEENEIIRLFLEGKGAPEIAEITRFSSKSKISAFLKFKGLRRTTADYHKARALKNKIGRKFNLLTVLDRVTDDQGKSAYKCLCDCGNTVTIRGSGIFNGKTRSCGCLLGRRGKDNPNWGGAGEISGQVFSSIRAGAALRNLPFEISVDFIWELFLKQNRKCAISGLDINFSLKEDQEKTASLDRIDSNKGYTVDNVQWVHKYVNFLKREIHDIDFFTIVKHVYEYKRLNEYSTSDLLTAFKNSPYFHRFNE